MPETPADFSGFSCPASPARGSQVLMGHGGGGAMSQELLEQIFLPAFGNPLLGGAGVAQLPGWDGDDLHDGLACEMGKPFHKDSEYGSTLL